MRLFCLAQCYTAGTDGTFESKFHEAVRSDQGANSLAEIPMCKRTIYNYKVMCEFVEKTQRLKILRESNHIKIFALQYPSLLSPQLLAVKGPSE
jgi:hypothetical protein